LQISVANFLFSWQNSKKLEKEINKIIYVNRNIVAQFEDLLNQAPDRGSKGQGA